MAHIGLILPAIDKTKNIVCGNGLLPDNVRTEILLKLENLPEVTSVELYHLDETYVKDGKVYSANNCLSDLDFVFWYYKISYDCTDWDLRILQSLSNHTKVVPNPNAVAIAVSYTHLTLPTTPYV